MRQPDLPARLRIAVAHVDGALLRLTRGADAGLPRAVKLATIRAISVDPLVLGHVVGMRLEPEHPEYAAADGEAVSLLRELGADEDHAQQVALWQRERRERERHGRGPI